MHRPEPFSASNAINLHVVSTNTVFVARNAVRWNVVSTSYALHTPFIRCRAEASCRRPSCPAPAAPAADAVFLSRRSCGALRAGLGPIQAVLGVGLGPSWDSRGFCWSRLSSSWGARGPSRGDFSRHFVARGFSFDFWIDFGALLRCPNGPNRNKTEDDFQLQKLQRPF